MYDLEVELDRFLKIKTNGRDDSVSNHINFPYEATPYCILQILANSGYISKRDKIIDFGCGKGRVDFYLAYSVKAKMIGVEFDNRLYNSALKNSQTALSSTRVSFVNCDARDYVIDLDITGAYFFNPFNVEVLECVINNLRKSKVDNDREIKCLRHTLQSIIDLGYDYDGYENSLEEALNELAASIKEHGVIQPIIVRKIGDKYEFRFGKKDSKGSR